MKKKMLTPEHFRSFLGMKDLGELINALNETDYAEDLEKSSVEYSGYAMIEDALVQHVQRLFSKLYRMAFDDAKMLVRVLLERFEVFNLKTILRGYHVGNAPEDTARSLFPTILYPTAFYQELLKRDGIGSVVDYLLTVGNRYYKPLAEALNEYEAGKKLALLESALDSYYFGGSRKSLQSIGDDNATAVRQIIGMETDILNMVYALRLIEYGVESEEKYRYILEGGERFDEQDTRELLNSPDKPTFIRKIEETYYGKKLGELDEKITANELQERLENLLYQENCNFDSGSGFDIAMSSAFIWRMNVEVTNVRVIASGIWRRAPQDDVMTRLIWVEGMMPELEAVKASV